MNIDRSMGMATSMGMPSPGSVAGLTENARAKKTKQPKPQLDQRMTQLKSGYRAVVVVDSGKCTGCGVCIDVCPANAIKVNEQAVINTDACTGCDACVWDCPNEAIAVAQIKISR